MNKKGFKYKLKKFFKKIEFSKVFSIIIAIIIGIIGCYSVISYINLMELAINNSSNVVPDVTLPVTCITTIFGTLLSYCIYQFGLKNSRNKYNVDADGIPFLDKMKELYDEMKNISDEITGDENNDDFNNS